MFCLNCELLTFFWLIFTGLIGEHAMECSALGWVAFRLGRRQCYVLLAQLFFFFSPCMCIFVHFKSLLKQKARRSSTIVNMSVTAEIKTEQVQK